MGAKDGGISRLRAPGNQGQEECWHSPSCDGLKAGNKCCRKMWDSEIWVKLVFIGEVRLSV